MSLPLCWHTRQQPAVRRFARVVQVAMLLTLVSVPLSAQRRGPLVLPPGPMLDGGNITLTSSALSVDVLKYSGTVARLTPQADPNLDYTPGDLLKQRSASTFYHLGDLDIRFRTASAAGWTDGRIDQLPAQACDLRLLRCNPVFRRRHFEPSAGHATQSCPHLGGGGRRPRAAFHLD